MKRKKNRHVRKERRLRLFVSLFTLILLFAGWVATSVLTAPKKDSVLELKRGEQVVLAKLTSKQVDPRFIPVLIYRMNSNDVSMASHAGVGTLFESTHGQQVLTAEHLLLQEFGTRIFGFKKLQPLDLNGAYGISRIMNTGRDIGVTNNPDIVVLGVGRPKHVVCYADRPADTSRESTVTSVLSTNWLTSLVSSERHRVVGLYKDPKDRVSYTLIEGYSVNGESGTGLIDEAGELYVLKGHMSWMGPEDKRKAEELLGTKKPLSIAFGPLKLH